MILKTKLFSDFFATQFATTVTNWPEYQNATTVTRWPEQNHPHPTTKSPGGRSR